MEEYTKDNYIEWIGELPYNWGISKIGELYSIKNIKVSDEDYPPLSVTKMGILPQLETAAKSDAHDDRKLVNKGDFVINSRSDRRGSCGISSLDGSVSLINIVLSPKVVLDPEYYNWLFHTDLFADEFYRWGHGIVDDLWTTNWQNMKNIKIPIPPLEEQKFISNFLNEKCEFVDSLINDEIAIRDKLAEYKSSLITEVVTKGLNNNVNLKDSNIDWIGKIPAHWDIDYLKHRVILNKSTLTEDTDDDYEFKYIDIGSVSFGKGIEKYETMLFKDAPSRARRIVEKDDVIISTVRTYLKAIAIIPDEKNLIVSTGFAVLTPININSRYLGYLVKSEYFTSLVSSYSVGVLYPAINSSKLISLLSLPMVLL